MTRLYIKDFIDKYADHAKAGDAIFQNASSLIINGDVILFDMQDLDGVSTVFLNTSLGNLMDTFGIERIKKSFKFVNVLRSQAERIRKYFSDYSEIHAINS